MAYSTKFRQHTSMAAGTGIIADMNANTTPHPDWHGIYVAAVTPLSPAGKLAPDDLPALLDLYAARGCHGVLLFGTTGEGPSFSLSERQPYIAAAAAWQLAHPGALKLLVGVGTPSLDDSIRLSQMTFGEGLDGVVCLPPYYFRTASEAGLTLWFDRVIAEGVPNRGAFFFYHFPQTAGLGIPEATVRDLMQRYPQRVAGLKDSSGEVASVQRWVATVPGLRVFAGHDVIMSAALAGGAAGMMTALNNVCSPLSRALYEAWQQGENVAELQDQLSAARLALVEGPVAPGIKAVMHARLGQPLWGVKPPMTPWTAAADALPVYGHVCDG